MGLAAKTKKSVVITRLPMEMRENGSRSENIKV